MLTPDPRDIWLEREGFSSLLENRKRELLLFYKVHLLFQDYYLQDTTTFKEYYEHCTFL